MLGKALAILRTRGPRALLAAASRRLRLPRAHSYAICRGLLVGAHGLEIGGPSSVFRRGGLLPVYPLLDSLDNCNFSAATLWEGTIEQGQTFRFDRRRAPGRQFIAEATRLDFAEAGSYDAVLSSHTLEHTANPIAALTEWTRVLREGGTLVVIVPHYEGTFDHRRPVTALDHLTEDFARRTGEDDLTHLPEILSLHDLAQDPAAGSLESFRSRSARNLENRCLHHHVFDTSLAIRLLDVVGLQLATVEPVLPHHIIAVAQKPEKGAVVDNRGLLGPTASWCTASPFARDRMITGS